MTNISDVYGKTFGPRDDEHESSYLDQDIFDPTSHEAKLQEARRIYDGNGKWNPQENKKVHFVQKYSESGLIAEAVIVGGVPYFAVARTNYNEITLERSLPKPGTSEYRPFELAAYLTKPYIFNQNWTSNHMLIGLKMRP
jgi:hypothetical protein